MRISMGYPDRKTEVEMLELHGGMREADSPARRGIALPDARYTAEVVLRMQGYLGGVYAEPGILQYVVDLARASRENPELALGASPRASLVLLQCAKGRALLQGRHYCTHEDIHEVLQPSWGHRLILRPEAEIEGRQIRDVIADLLQRVPVLKAAAK
jgi:MoxR-like ATPase